MGFLRFFKMSRNCRRVADKTIAASVGGLVGVGGGDSVRKFTWDEIERLTKKFSKVVGLGGFSTVYLGHFLDSSRAAIKIQCNSERLNRIYKQELQILLGIRHNIAKLLGYCDDREEGILVFEYTPNGNLKEILQGSRSSEANETTACVLPWKSRMIVAFQLAQALEYLHDNCASQIIHGDIKASNILLDENFNCKLCDFGSAKMGFSSTLPSPSSSRMNRLMLGSLGYTDPHYLRTGIASKKNDVYSFGVVVLELITGLEAFCPTRGEKLASIAAPMLRNSMKVMDMVDPSLDGRFDLEEAMAIASISAMCLSDSLIHRPCASDILEAMREKITSISAPFSKD